MKKIVLLGDSIRMGYDKYVKDALYVPFGIEPIVGFLQAKETEVMNLRMILTGKISGMDDVLIKERLRDTYV